MVKKPNNFLRFLTYVRPYWKYIFIATIGGIVKFTLPLFIPQVTRYLLDHVYLNSHLTTQAKLHQLFFNVGGLIILFILFWAPWTFFRHYHAGKAGQRSVFDLRQDLYYQVLRMSASFFQRHKSGGIVSRLINDITLAQNLVGTALTNVWMDGISLIVILYFLFRIHVTLTIVSLLTFPIYIYFYRTLGDKLKSSSYQVQQETESISGSIQEKISGNRVVHAFSQEENEQQNFIRDSEKLFATTMRTVYLSSINITVANTLTNIAPLIVALFGGYLVIQGHLTIGGLVAVTMYLGPLYLPLQRFSELNLVFASSMASLDRIFEIMDELPEITDKPNAVELKKIEGNVQFEHVTFAYDSEKPVLTDISFTINAGQKIALVGHSGSGKTTIVSLLPRFFDVAEGAVNIDGWDIRDLKVKSLRSHIGIVLQDPVLFSGSIRDNIQYGNSKASLTEIIAACKAANAYDFIKELPQGFETEVGERGAFLSGGQKQRLTIARAFLKDPKILILDEATSNLDTESERLIQEALERLMENRTTIIIAHRLSTVIYADQILVLHNGSILESGTHHELITANGIYQSLYSCQFETNSSQAG